MSSLMALSATAAERPPVYETFKTPYGNVYGWGSAAQGFVFTDRYSFFGSEDDAFNYREISLGGQYEFLDRYSVTLQGEYRDAGESDNLGLRLSQAFVDGYMSPRPDTILGVNLGRVEIPLGFYNRTRDRVDTRPSIVLPQSVYLEGLGLRDILLTGDGGMFYGLHEINKRSRIESKMAMARSSFVSVDGLEDAWIFSGWTGYVWDDKLSLRLTLLLSEKDDTKLTFPVLSAQYKSDGWTLTSEWGNLKLDAPFGRVETDGIYGQVEYAVTGNFSLFGRYDYLKFGVDTVVPIEISDDRLRAQSLAFGFGYDITKHFRLNAEYHLMDGKAYLNDAENPGLDAGPEDWNMLVIMGSVRF